MMRYLSALNTPVAMRRANAFFTLFWIAMCVPSILFGWINSVTFVSFLSLWALIASHWAAWQSARVEVRQDEDADVQEVLEAVENKDP